MLSLDELQAKESQADGRWRVDVQAEGICQVRCLAWHSQYKGTVYCPSTETVSKDQWLEDMKKR